MHARLAHACGRTGRMEHVCMNKRSVHNHFLRNFILFFFFWGGGGEGVGRRGNYFDGQERKGKRNIDNISNNCWNLRL